MLNTKFEGRSRMGGITRVEFGFVDAQARTYPAEFHQVRFIRESAKFEEKQKNAAGGTIYQQSLRLRKSQLEATIMGWTAQNAHKLFIFRVWYANGTTIETGTTEYPLECLTAASSGKKTSDRNEANFRFRGEGTAPAKVIQSTPSTTVSIPAPGGGAGSTTEAMATTKIIITEMVGGEPVVITHNQNLSDPQAFLFKLVLPGDQTHTTHQVENATANSFTFLAPVSFSAPDTAVIHIAFF